jgi:putative DNA primase/helicase
LASESGWVNTAKKLDSKSNIAEDSSTGFNWLCADEMANNAKAPEYLINKILETDSHGLLAGGSMAFKTFVDLRMAYSICTGSNFFGYEVYTTGKVLYICGEGKGALSRRIKALKIVEGDFLGNLLVLDETISIDNAVQMAQLGMEIEKIKPVFIIFDTYSSLIGGVDENSNSEVSRSLKLIRETCGNASSLVVHHYGKDAARGSRGAGAFKANVDFEFALVREENTMNTVLSCVKMKDGEMFDDLNLTAHIVELGLIGQDGMQSSSLVLKPNVEIEIGHDAIVFTSLKDAWILDGVESDKYGNGASVELWKKTALVALNNLGKNKYREFSRSKARLIENKKIIEIDGFCFLSH